MDLVAGAGLEVFVEPFLHELAVLVRDAALHALVDEVERAIERHADPHDPSLDDLVEVARRTASARRRAPKAAARDSSSEGGSGASASSTGCGWLDRLPHAVTATTAPTSRTAANARSLAS